MISYVLRRLGHSVIVMLMMSVLVFIAVYAIGNPVEVLIDPRATEQDIQRTMHELGLDLPIWEQYFVFLGNIFHGDTGISWVFNEPALTIMLQRMPATLELAACAILIAIAVGIPLGLIAGRRPNSRLSQVIMGGSLLGISLPAFWVGLMLIVLFGVELNWLPILGRGRTVQVLGVPFSVFTADGLAHLILPSITLALSRIAMVIRMVRAGVREVLMQDYIRFARARGLRESRIMGVHVLKSVLIPVVTFLGTDFAGLLAFAVVTETVFAWPGMGKLIVDSIAMLDRPMIVAYLMTTVLIFMLVNLVVDLLYGLLDPRVRMGEAFE